MVIFNRAYEICDFIKDEKHPEELAARLWQHSEQEFISDEVSVIYSCVYIILSFTGSGNPNMVFFLTRLRQMIDSKYLSVFEPLLEEELTDIPVLPKSFARLKTLGDRIDNLNDRELFYTEYLTRYKQAKSAGRGDRWYDATGWCAYTTRGDTRADALATCLYDAARFHLHGQRLRTDYTDGDPDLEADFYILRRTIPPAVLVENFFMDSDTRLSLPSQS